MSEARYWGTLMGVLTLVSLVSGFFPGIDVFVSGLFYDREGGFVHTPFLELAHHIGPYLVICAALATAVFLAIKKIIPLQGLGFVAGSFLLGPGLIINGILKEYYGRARPHDTELFGGHLHFTSALTMTDQCYHNCSFTSGDPSVGFSLVAFALLLPQSRVSITIAALCIGMTLGFMRIAQGAHFLSDVLFTAVISTGTSLFLYVVMSRFSKLRSLSLRKHAP
jgi:lipid A 4'-phosphatase